MGDLSPQGPYALGQDHNDTVYKDILLNHNIKFNISNINIKQNVSIIPLSEFNSVEWFPVKIWEWGLVEGDNYSVQQSISNHITKRFVDVKIVGVKNSQISAAKLLTWILLNDVDPSNVKRNHSHAD